MEKLKNLAILVVVIVIGYFGYQHFFAGAAMDNEDAEEEYIVTTDIPPVPAGCESMVSDVENAVYGARTGQVSVAQRNRIYGTFTDCLMEQGFSKAEVRGVLAQIEDKISKYQ